MIQHHAFKVPTTSHQLTDSSEPSSPGVHDLQYPILALDPVSPHPGPGVERVAGDGGVRRGAQGGTEPQLGLGGVHDRDQPVPGRLQLVLQVHLV